MVSVFDLHWAAGLFEGEGTITIAMRKSDETFRLVCTLCSTDESIVDFFHERWSGWKQPLYGNRAKMGRQPGWSWTTAGPGADSFLNDIYWFLRTPRVKKKTELALRFRSVQRLKQRDRLMKDCKRDLYMQMKNLNLRGVAATRFKAAS